MQNNTIYSIIVVGLSYLAFCYIDICVFNPQTYDYLPVYCYFKLEYLYLN